MRNYDYNKLLSPREFEFFSKSIIEKKENKEFEIFSEGKDNGIDLRNIENNFVTIVQVKRIKDSKSLINELKNSEIKKLQKLNPNRYIIITSSSISVNDKIKIKDIFKNYPLEEDIIGCEQLNSLLENPEYKNIENEYYQLWINSTNSLQHFIKKNLNNDTYFFTKYELDNIYESVKTYVRHENFSEALNIIKDKKCLLICGEPEIGKTTLARNLCAYFMAKDENLEFIYTTKISKIPNLFDDEKNQLFFIDDFWGSKFDGNLNSEEEVSLKRIIKIINKSKNKLLILTSREYILSQGYAKYPELEEFFDNYKLNLHIEDYSDLFKARILFKHLEYSDLNLSAIYQIANGYKRIIYNDNYRPRIIENYINYVSDKEIEPQNYLEDFVYYLKHPYKLWKEIFEKQHEGAQLITILMLVIESNYIIKLEHLKNIYESYIDYVPNINLKKSDFLKYISQLENTLITTYTEDDKNEVLVKFKNSSIENFIYKFFIENTGEYVKNIINCTPYINSLMFLAGSWSILETYQTESLLKEGIYYDISNNTNLINAICIRLINDLDKLIYFENDTFAGYSESKDNYVYKINLCMLILKDYPSKMLNIFLQEKISDILYDLENNKYFIYEDLFDIPSLVYKSIKLNINNTINILKIMRDSFKAIRFSRQFLILKDFKSFFPKEYKIFYNEIKTNLKSHILNMILDDANFFLDDYMYDELEELTDFTIPSLCDSFSLKITKKFAEEYYFLTDIDLLPSKSIDNTFTSNGNEKIYNYENETEQQEKVINKEKDELIDKVFDEVYEVNIDEFKTYIHNNISNSKLAKNLENTFMDYDKNYIRIFTEHWSDIELLIKYINYINRIPQNSKDFCENFIKFIQIENPQISDNIIEKLKDLAFFTFKEGRERFFKRELTTYFSDDIIDELLKCGIIYNIRKKHYFINIYFHLYLALLRTIENHEDLASIYTNQEYQDFSNLFNDICYTYSDIDLNTFNTKFLSIQTNNIIDAILDNNIDKMILNFASYFSIEIEFNTNINSKEYDIIIGSSESDSNALLAINYLGFNILDIACNKLNIKEMQLLFKETFNNGNSSIILEEALKNNTSIEYKLLEKLGCIKYLKCFCFYLTQCKHILSKNSKTNLRNSFNLEESEL